MEKKWSFKQELTRYYFFNKEEDGCAFGLECSPETAQQICDALNDFRPWRTGVPEKEGYYEVTKTSALVDISFFDGYGHWEISFCESQLGIKVTAFRSLPEPFKG